MQSICRYGSEPGTLVIHEQLHVVRSKRVGSEGHIHSVSSHAVRKVGSSLAMYQELAESSWCGGVVPTCSEKRRLLES
jgi:hypothetical protein